VKIAAGIAAALVFVLVVMTMSLGAAVGGQQPMISPMAVAGIPPLYLQLYVSAAQQNKLDWAILAAIGSIETDHGRSTAPGVHSGRNTNGCCAGPMQFSFDTWKTYGKGGDIYNPVDAIPAAARYLRAGGAPQDYHAAILSYNHAEWYYRQVMDKAQEYRAAATMPASGQSQAGPISGSWLANVPGTQAQCDARIVPNVVMLLARYHAWVSDCYAPTGHESSGEHPLGLAVDLTPANGNWAEMEQLARFAGWRPSCASSGCAGQTHTAFRFVGWNGYPGHGDPAHAGSNAHLHLSWSHGPGHPARWVSLIAAG
jgi:hypothetical protein